MAKMRVLVTGAAGYIASQMLPTFRERYDLVLVDVTDTDRDGNSVEEVVKANLIDPDRSGYEALFQGVDAVVHLGYRRRSGEAIDHFFHEKENVEMAYNVLRTSYDSGVGRVAMASSNHAADWYEHALIHTMRIVPPSVTTGHIDNPSWLTLRSGLRANNPGRHPVSAFPLMSSSVRLDRMASSEGKLPLSMLLLRFSILRLDSLDSSGGISPLSRLPSSSSRVTCPLPSLVTPCHVLSRASIPQLVWFFQFGPSVAL